MRRRVLAAVTITLGATAVASAQTQLNQIYSQNPGAEDGTTNGWTSALWAAQRYSDVGAQPVAFSNSPNPTSSQDWVFAAHAPHELLSQSVSLQAAADEIDAGKAEFTVLASLGGEGAGASGASVIAQVTDGDGRPQGAPVLLGPPTAADRRARNGLISCAALLPVSPGARGVIITIESTPATTQDAPALADDVFVADHAAFTAVGGAQPADGQSCETWPATSATPTPTSSSTPTPSAYPVPVPLAVKRVRLTHRRVSFTATARAHFRVNVARGGRVRRRFSVTGAGRLSHGIRRLPDGRYRVTVRARGKQLASVRRRPSRSG